MNKSITPGQLDQYKRFIEDAAKKALKRIPLDRGRIQCLIGNGGELQADIEDSIRRLSGQILGEAEKTRRYQIERLRCRGCDVNNEDDILFPDTDKLKLGSALLVDYETPIGEQCQKLGIMNCLNLDYHKDLHQKPQGRWGWIYGVEDGKLMLGKSPNNCIQEFERNKRRGLMTVEGLALYRENFDLLKDHYVDLSGSRFVEFGDNAPCLYLNDGRPKLFDYRADFSYPRWGSASALV